MADKLQISIIGMGLIGASAGLALRRHGDKVIVVGHDKAPGLASQAKSKGAVNRTHWNLINAVSDADRIILALPASDIRASLEAIAEDLKPGCIIVDTAPVKAQVMQWAKELLPESVHLVGGHPIVLVENVDPAGAQADLFDEKFFCLTPDGQTDTTAVRLAADLVEALGAKAFFLDAVEHDGLVAAVEHLPLLVAGALMTATSRSSSWQDMRKLASSQFYSSTLTMAEDGQEAVSALAANRDQALRWIDLFIEELGQWQRHLADADDEELTDLFDKGLGAGRRWVNAYTTGDWEREDAPKVEMPNTGDFMRSLVGFGRFGRKSSDDKKKR